MAVADLSDTAVTSDPRVTPHPAGRGFMAMVALLYVSQGLPMGLAMEALPALMRSAGAPLDIIAWVPLTGLPWILKLFWAPLVENRTPLRLGRRRGWILSMQAVLVLSMLVLGFIGLSGSGIWIALAVLTIGGIASATQDTATDGLVAESLTGGALARANAWQVGGLMAGFMIGGAGALIALPVLGQAGTLAALALIPLASLIAAATWQEPASAPKRRAKLRQTFARIGIWRMLAVAAVFGGAHAGGLSVSRVLLIDQGWGLSEVGVMGTLSGALLVVIGCPLGAALATRSTLLTVAGGMAMAAASFALWAAIGSGDLPATWSWVAPATALLSVASGLIAVAAYTLLMAFAGKGAQAGTDATVLQSASVSGEMLFAGLAVWFAGAFGYGASLGWGAAAVAVLALAVVILSRRGGPKAAQS